jgi:hypothetical protein
MIPVRMFRDTSFRDTFITASYDNGTGREVSRFTV